MNTFSSHSKGFTLLETIVSVAILSFVIIGPLSAIVNSSSYARKTKDTMTATYLAEGTVELLQNQYDSIYVFCRKQPDDSMCKPLALTPNESTSQIAWRVFKVRFAATDGQPSCFNPVGCSFDSLDLLGSVTSTPTRYIANSPECSSLVDVAIPVTVSPSSNTQVGGIGTTATISTVRHAYRCNGVASHIPINSSTSTKTFKRSVVMEILPVSFESVLPSIQQYNDDIRVVSKVEFKTFRNATTSVMITRFMHAHQ
jgi:prepilin-type N-terminal cleavage/methylation domain-containing protein